MKHAIVDVFKTEGLYQKYADVRDFIKKFISIES